MNSAEGTLETYATRLNSLDGTTISLGNRMSAAEGTLETYVTKTNAIDGSLTSLGTRMNAVEKRFTSYVLTDTFNGTVGDINVTLNRHWSAIEQTDKNLLLSINKSTGYPLNKDVKFVKGMNGISRYNNSGGGSVAVRRIVIYRGASVPSTSNPPAGGWTTDDVRAAHVDDVYYDSSTGTWYTYAVSGTSYAWREGTPEFGTVPAEQAAVIRIRKAVGNSSPGLGGFTFSTPSRANAVFEARFTAKIPAGYRLNFASNGVGNNGHRMWITDNAGTGDWKEYRYQVFCGASGSFSTTNFFYLTKDVPAGQTNDDYNTAVTWYLKEATVFDLSSYEDPVTYINLTEGLAKIKAKRIELEGLVTVNSKFKVLQDGTIEAVDGKFSGTLTGVTGSFKSLNCVNSEGKTVGGISFGTDGKMWFSGDMYHQGYDYVNKRSYRLYSSNLWCRGSFGASGRNTLVVLGSYGYFYVNGLASETGKVYVSLVSAQSSNNETYYTIPLYGTSGDAAGFPVDLVIIRTTGTYRYLLSGDKSQRVTVINTNDQNNNIYIYSNGTKVQWAGGEIADCRNIEDFMSPAPAGNLLGRGWIIGAFRDNNWS